MANKRKKVSASKLASMAASGAKVERKEKPVVIADFGAVVTQLETIGKQQKALIETLNKLLIILATRKEQPQPAAEPVDWEPFRAMLAEFSQAMGPVEHQGYEFEFERGHGGFLSKIIATPLSTTKH